MLDPHGIKFTYEVKSMMMGKKSLEAIKIMLKHYNLDLNPESYQRDREVLLDEMFKNCDLMPGALRLLIHLKNHNIPMAIATSSHKRHFDLKIMKHKDLFQNMFDHVITGDEVTQSKPNPEIFIKAAQKFGQDFNAAEFLVFEDSPLGVQAGVKAGMPVVWVYDQNQPKENLFQATQKIKSLMHFSPQLYGLPPF